MAMFPVRAVYISLLALGLCFQLPGSGADLPKAVLRETGFDFGTVVRGRRIDHEILLINQGTAPLVIHKVAMTPPLRINRIPPQIPPGGSVALLFSLETGAIAGRFEGQIVLFLNDKESPEIHLAMEGDIVNIVEVAPMPAFFVATVRGVSREQALEIVNHDSAPMDIESVEHPRDRFTTRLETVLPGRRYRLTLSVKPEAPMGRSVETVEVRTSNPSRPILRIPANIWVHERVYAVPDEVDFGTIPLSALQAHGTTIAQSVMVYQASGKDFRVTARTDLPEVELLLERGRDGDRYQVTVRLRSGKIQPGPIHGMIHLEANDARVPQLAIPVTGSIVSR